MTGRLGIAIAFVFCCVVSSRAALAADPAPFEIGAEGVTPCGAEAHLEAALQRDPEIAARRAALESLILEAQRNGLVPLKGNSTNTAATYTIPTVVHIIHTGVSQPEYISDNQVKSQIAAVNRDLRNLLNYGSPATDVQIELCLVNKDPNGQSNWVGAAGITRHFDGTYNATLAMDVLASETTMKAFGYFDSKKYLNVWVVKRITVGGGGGVIGFATFPGSVTANLDGIVMDYRVMGANNTGFGTFSSLLPTYTEGKVFAHEVGHYLDLYHPFHNGCAGDQVNDTNPEANNHWACPSGSPTTICNNNAYVAPIHNFMEYTNDACRWEFTPGQQTRMFAAIANVRSTLVSAANLVAVDACPPTVTAVITPSQIQQCLGQPITFSAPNCTGACTYTWTFQNGSGNTSAQNTFASFNATGPQLVSLSVSNGTQTSNATITVFITACTPITGPCTNWVFGNGVRLSFASGLPVAVAGNYRNMGEEAAAQMSAANGNLLFYTNNDTIWNVNDVPMALSGSNTQPLRGKSSHTGALVIPRPGVNINQITNEYYLLSIIQAESWGQGKPPFALTTVDMNGGGGLGTITNTNAAVTMPQGVSAPPNKLMETVTAIPKCNGFDWWAITVGCDSTNSMYDWERFLYVTSITNGGAGTTQQFASGFAGPSPINGYSAWGAITPSPDGTRIAICQAEAHEIHVFDFDRVTGMPGLPTSSGNVEANQDLEWSPDGKLIYYCYVSGNFYLPNTFGKAFYGVRVWEPSTGTIRTIIPAAPPAGLPFDLQRGPDGRIYISRPSILSPPQLQTSLDVINFPNTLNSSNSSNECGFVANAIPLAAGTHTSVNGSLPNTIPFCAPSTLPPASFTWVENPCKSVTFTTPNCPPFTWNFGDGSNPVGTNSQTITHPYPSPSTQGTYTVTLTAPSCNPTLATQQITIGPTPISISGPGSACGGPLNYSVTGPSNLNYVWTITGGSPPSATGNNVNVNWGLGTNATIQVTGTDPKTGCVSTAIKTVDPCANCSPPPSKMIAWWPLDEASGTNAKELVAAHDGTDAGAPAKAAGAVSNARYFSGTLDYVQANHHPQLDLGTGNLTIDAWIRTSSNPTYQGIVEKRSLSPDLGYALYLKDTQLAFSMGDGTTSTEWVATNSAPLNDGYWHHVAATEDRNNGSAGTTLYVDGMAVNVYPAFTGSFSLDNTENLLIGAMEPSSSPAYLFVGGIDEVEIFNRALTDVEVAKIYGSGAGGKCKELAYVPAAQTFCGAAPDASVTVYLCSYGPTAQNYSLSFAGVTGAGCTTGPPTNFTITSTNTNGVIMNVGPGCQPVTVKIGKPGGMNYGDVACFSVTATNTSSNVTRTTYGSFYSSEAVCPILKSNVLTSVGVGVSVPHTWQLNNLSIQPQVVQVQAEAIGVDQPPMPGGGVMSLNGLPPGVPWTATFVLVPGESALVNVDAAFTEPTPFVPFDIILSADFDGNGSADAKVAAGMLNSETPLTVTSVPRAPVPTRFSLLSTWPNPFHRMLGVELALPKAGPVKLELFDVGGRRVRSAVYEVEAGRTLRKLDGSGLHSGIYLLRVEAQGQIRTKRVAMLRK